MKNQKPEDDLFQTEPVENRAQLLEDQSCRTEDMQVKRDFNSSQLTELKDELIMDQVVILRDEFHYVAIEV